MEQTSSNETIDPGRHKLNHHPPVVSKSTLLFKKSSATNPPAKDKNQSDTEMMLVSSPDYHHPSESDLVYSSSDELNSNGYQSDLGNNNKFKKKQTMAEVLAESNPSTKPTTTSSSIMLDKTNEILKWIKENPNEPDVKAVMAYRKTINDKKFFKTLNRFCNCSIDFTIRSLATIHHHNMNKRNIYLKMELPKSKSANPMSEDTRSAIERHLKQNLFTKQMEQWAEIDQQIKYEELLKAKGRPTHSVEYIVSLKRKCSKLKAYLDLVKLDLFKIGIESQTNAVVLLKYNLREYGDDNDTSLIKQVIRNAIGNGFYIPGGIKITVDPASLDNIAVFELKHTARQIEVVDYLYDFFNLMNGSRSHEAQVLYDKMVKNGKAGAGEVIDFVCVDSEKNDSIINSAGALDEKRSSFFLLSFNGNKVPPRKREHIQGITLNIILNLYYCSNCNSTSHNWFKCVNKNNTKVKIVSSPNRSTSGNYAGSSNGKKKNGAYITKNDGFIVPPRRKVYRPIAPKTPTNKNSNPMHVITISDSEDETRNDDQTKKIRRTIKLGEFLIPGSTIIKTSAKDKQSNGVNLMSEGISTPVKNSNGGEHIQILKRTQEINKNNELLENDKQELTKSLKRPVSPNTSKTPTAGNSKSDTAGCIVTDPNHFSKPQLTTVNGSPPRKITRVESNDKSPDDSNPSSEHKNEYNIIHEFEEMSQERKDLEYIEHISHKYSIYGHGNGNGNGNELEQSDLELEYDNIVAIQYGMNSDGEKTKVHQPSYNQEKIPKEEKGIDGIL